jgi:hypothetical protein
MLDKFTALFLQILGDSLYKRRLLFIPASFSVFSER